MRDGFPTSLQSPILRQGSNAPRVSATLHINANPRITMEWVASPQEDRETLEDLLSKYYPRHEHRGTPGYFGQWPGYLTTPSPELWTPLLSQDSYMVPRGRPWPYYHPNVLRPSNVATTAPAAPMMAVPRRVQRGGPRAPLPKKFAPTSFTTFQLEIDVDGFAPHELIVKTQNKTVIVEGKQLERSAESQEKHCLLSRQFIKKFKVSSRIDLNQLKCIRYSDRYLRITAPVMPLVAPRQIPIIPHIGSRPTVQRYCTETNRRGVLMRDNSIMISLDETPDANGTRRIVIDIKPSNPTNSPTMDGDVEASEEETLELVPDPQQAVQHEILTDISPRTNANRQTTTVRDEREDSEIGNYHFFDAPVQEPVDEVNDPDAQADLNEEGDGEATNEDAEENNIAIPIVADNVAAAAPLNADNPSASVENRE